MVNLPTAMRTKILSVFCCREAATKSSSPSIRSEAPSFIVARAAKPLVFGAKHQTQNVVRQSRTNILPKIHRGAENALHYLCAPAPSKCDRTAVTPSFFMRPKGALHTPKACFMCRRHASFAASAALFSSLSPHFIKKISFQCKFFASVCKKLLQKG